MTSGKWIKSVFLLLVGGAIIALIIAWGGSIGLARSGRLRYAAGSLDGTNWLVWRNDAAGRAVRSAGPVPMAARPGRLLDAGAAR